MKRVIGFAGIGLGGIGVAGCLAGLIVIWVVRPSVLRSSADLLDAADGGLKIVDEKASRADVLIKTIRGIVDPVTGRILKLADKTNRTPEDEKELKRIEESLTQRLGQVEIIAELAETAIAFLKKSSQLAKSLRFSSAGKSPEEELQGGSDILSRLAKALNNLREKLAEFREERQVRKKVVDAIVSFTRDVDNELKGVESNLERVRQKAAELGTEVVELRSTIPTGINRAAIIGSVILVCLGLGQLMLLRWGWDRIRSESPK